MTVFPAQRLLTDRLHEPPP